MMAIATGHKKQPKAKGRSNKMQPKSASKIKVVNKPSHSPQHGGGAGGPAPEPTGCAVKDN
jgi:hypothetical protein